MDKQKQYSARPQGFRGNSRPAPAKAQEDIPKKKPVRKRPEKRAKRRVQRKKRISMKKLAIIIAAALLAALIAFLVIRGVIISKNKTVHMLPEIYDVATPEPTSSVATAGEGEPEALDNFIAEGSGA